MKTILSIIIALVPLGLVRAQEVKLAGVDYTYYPKATIADSDQRIDYQEFGAFVQVPIVLKDEKNVFNNNLSYKLVSPTLHPLPSSDESTVTERYHTINYSLAGYTSSTRVGRLLPPSVLPSRPTSTTVCRATTSFFRHSDWYNIPSTNASTWGWE